MLIATEPYSSWIFAWPAPTPWGTKPILLGREVVTLRARASVLEPTAGCGPWRYTERISTGHSYSTDGLPLDGSRSR